MGTIATQVTHGIKISVETKFQNEHSEVENRYFLFAYFVTIENKSDFTVQLLSRHWYIYDAVGSLREVEGEGVIGVQPQISAGEKYQYISGCSLSTEMGKMYGTYTMENVNTKKSFSVAIPAFEMTVPFKMN